MPASVQGEPSHVEVRISLGVDTHTYVDREARLPMLTLVAGPVEVIIAPGGAELGEADVAAADALAESCVEYAHRVRKLVAGLDDGDALVRLEDVPPTEVTGADIIRLAGRRLDGNVP